MFCFLKLPQAVFKNAGTFSPALHLGLNKSNMAVYLCCLFVYLFLLASPLQAQVTEEWAKRYNNSTATGYDDSQAIVTDAQGFVYITGHSSQATASTYNYVTVKYTPQGSQVWAKTYDGPAGGVDGAKAIAVDAQGNVYVTGNSAGVGTGNDFATIKYDAQGNVLWVKRYNSAGNGNDEANALIIDSQGNLHVGGTAGSASYVKVKYDLQGNQVQVVTYNIGTSGFAEIKSAAFDGMGNLYLTGTSSTTSDDDYLTVKYNAAGTRQWAKIYTHSTDSNDEPIDIALDSKGNVYVTGFSSSVPYPDYFYEYATVKYDSQGNEKWVRRYSKGAQTYNYPKAIVVDKSDRVYVTGYANLPEGNGHVYATIQYDSEGNQLSVKHPDIASLSTSYIIFAVDAFGNLYYSGTRFVTLKYNTQGSLAWKSDYNSAGNGEEFAVALTTDKQGNIYVTGRISHLASEADWYFDMATVKYDAQGNQKWVKKYKGPQNGDDQPVDIAIDPQGNVIVTGFSFGGSTKPYSFPHDNDYNYDILTLAYSPDGTKLWEKRYASAGEGVDEATDLEVDSQGNVYVTGSSSAVVGDNKSSYITIKYNTQGNQVWAATSTKGYKASALTVDAQGNVYVTGNLEIYADGVITIKYDPAGNELWMKEFVGKNSAATAADITVDALSNVYITGSSSEMNQYYDYRSYFATVKYDSKGNQLWVKYLYKFYGIDPILVGRVLAVDPQGNIYVGGYRTTIKYDTQGNQQWEKAYTGTVTDLKADAQGNVYITGGSGSYKYDTQGNQLWAKPYTGSPVALHLDAQNNVFITGWSEGNDTFRDFLTVKYSQQTEPLACTASSTILQEIWRNASGSLITNIPLNTPPTSFHQLTSFETAANAGSNYGQRIRGFLCAPATGNYTFYIAGDDQAELWLSTTDDPAKKTKIASVPYYTSARQWSKYPAQKSASIALVAGKTYYIEALHKEGLYADHLSVGWQTPASATIAVIPGTVLSPAAPAGSGTVARERWDNITGTAVSAIPVNTTPASVTQLTSFETPSNAGTNYGQRIRGYVHPQVSGNYYFYIAGDDNCELYLSTDEDPEKKVRIAYITGRGAFAGQRQWNKYLSQKSLVVPLSGGKKYYIEALHKESLYADNLAVGWMVPNGAVIEVIPGSRLSPFLPAPASIVRMGAEESITNHIKLYPNPFQDKLTILTPYQGKLRISLTDNLGRTVYQSAIDGSQPETTIDLAYLKAGVYVGKVSLESGQIQLIKVVKK